MELGQGIGRAAATTGEEHITLSCCYEADCDPLAGSWLCDIVAERPRTNNVLAPFFRALMGLQPGFHWTLPPRGESPATSRVVHSTASRVTAM